MADNTDAERERSNWVTMSCAMCILTDGLKDCVNGNMAKLHQNMYRKLAYLVVCVRNCTKSESICKKWCASCCSWKEELVHHHLKKQPTIQWNFINSSRWSLSYEEITKVFIPNLHNDPKLTLDLPNIMSLFENCSVFNIHRDLIEAIRKVRNRYVVHNGEFKINDNGLEKCFNRMFTLLHDPSIKGTASGKRGLEKLKDLKERGVLDFLKDNRKENKDLAELVILVEQSKNQNCDIKEQLAEIKQLILQKECNSNNTTCINRSSKRRHAPELISTAVFAIIIVFLSMSMVSKYQNNTGCMTMEFRKPWENEIGFREYLGGYFNLTGREWVIEHIASQITASDGGLLLSARMGYGKTALVSKLLCADRTSTAYKLRKKVLAFHMCKYDDLTTQQPEKFIRNIVGKIASEVPEFEQEILINFSQCAEHPTGCLDSGLIFPLSNIAKQDKYIIVIDALDECDSRIGRGKESVLSLLINRTQNFPNWIKFIMTARDNSPITTKFTTLKHIHLGENDIKHLHDVELYAFGRLSSHYNLEGNVSITDDIHTISHTLIQQTNGNFLYLKHAIDLLINLKVNISMKLPFLPLPDSLGEFYLQNFERVFSMKPTLFEKAKVVFEIMCASLMPLHESTLLDIAKLLDDSIDNRFLKYLGKELGHLLVYNEDKLYFAHKAVRDWLIDDQRQNSSYLISLHSGNKLISKYYIFQLLSSKYQTEISDAMSMLVKHLSESIDKNTISEFSQVIKVFTNETFYLVFKFIEQNAMIEDVFPITKDHFLHTFGRALTASILYMIQIQADGLNPIDKIIEIHKENLVKSTTELLRGLVHRGARQNLSLSFKNLKSNLDNEGTLKTVCVYDFYRNMSTWINEYGGYVYLMVNEKNSTACKSLDNLDVHQNFLGPFTEEYCVEIRH